MPVFVLLTNGERIKISDTEEGFTLESNEVFGLSIIKADGKVFWFNMDHVMAIGAHI